MASTTLSLPAQAPEPPSPPPDDLSTLHTALIREQTDPLAPLHAT